MRGRTRQVFARQWCDGQARRRPDDVIVEEPLTIQLDDETVATTMRTPGDDFELAVGFCFGDGQIGTDSVESIRYCGTGSALETEFNVVSITTDGTARPRVRLGNVSSSCGLCGSDAIDELRAAISPLTDHEPFDPQVLVSVAEAMASRQTLFRATGASHGAASFTRDGTIGVVREDIGRHNAVDKVVGRLYLDGALPDADAGLFVSGRASFEMVQKAWAAGFGTLLAISAPSALAIEAAAAGNIHLAGFVREGRMNLYT